MLDTIINSAEKDDNGISPDLIKARAIINKALDEKVDTFLKQFSLDKKANIDDKLESEFIELNLKLDDIEGRIKQEKSKLKNSAAEIKVFSINEVQPLIEKDAVLLRYYLGEKDAQLFIIDTNSVKTIELPVKTEIEQLTRKYFGLLLSPIPLSAHETAEIKAERKDSLNKLNTTAN